MRGVIIAGGLGTRLRPLTYGRPKAIVPLLNRPFIEYQIELLRDHGITDIIVNLHYMPEYVKTVLGDGESLGVKLYYSIEEKPMGTAGAVKLAEALFDEGPIIVLNGDIVFDIDLSAMLSFHKRKRARATIALVRVEDPTSYGLIIMDSTSRIIRFLEKPDWEEVTTNTINAGVYVIDPELFRDVPRDRPYSFERELYPGLLQKEVPVYGFVVDRYWIDIGSPQKYLRVHHDILHNTVPFPIRSELRSPGVYADPTAQISSNAKIVGPSLIGEHVVIGADVQINESVVLGPRVKIGRGTRLSHCVIWEETVIGQNCELEGCIVGAHCQIEDNANLARGVVLGDRSVVTQGSKLI